MVWTREGDEREHGYRLPTLSGVGSKVECLGGKGEVWHWEEYIERLHKVPRYRWMELWCIGEQGKRCVICNLVYSMYSTLP